MTDSTNDSRTRSGLGRAKRPATRLAIGLTAGTLAAGAALALPAESPLGPVTASASTRLDRFEDCDALAAWYIQQALPEVTAWGLGGGYPMYWARDAIAFRSAESPVVLSSTQSDGAEGAVGNGPTGTNVQEEGVDEPDIAKVMGDLVVSTHRNALIVTDVSGDTPVEIGRVELPNNFWSYELLLVGDRAVVTGTASMGGPIMIDAGFRGFPGAYGDARSSVTTVDLADPSDPKIVDRQTFEGSIVTSRSHDGTVRIVASSTSHADFDFVYPGRGTSRAEARERNLEIVRESQAQDWLPQASTDASGHGGVPLLDCDDVMHPEVGSGLGTITVLTLDPTDPDSTDATAVSADGSLVYASADRLYVSTVGGGWDAWGLQTVDDDSWKDPDTEIHAFDTTDDQTSYVASGAVKGVVPDRWAFSEEDGLLRVASTYGSSWNPTSSAITVLEERGDALVSVGDVGGLGPDEQIQAVRWFGDLALVVTFRQVDPLYAVDLSDPTAPRVIDELKVTGFSGYLHPIGGDLILGVGQGGDEKGNTTGAQVSTFDIADLTDLALVDRLGFGAHSWSPVEDESRAFTYLPDQRIALVPTTGWSRGSTGINVVRVGEDGTLSLTQTVDVRGWEYNLRGLPLDDGRVAIVQDGHVEQILDLT